ncbi:DoxX family membrane protein [soil metagenome]
MTLIRLAARPMLASMFVMGGVDALRNTEEAAARAKPVADQLTRAAERVAPQVPMPKDEVTLVRVSAAVQIASALALATGRVPRLSATVLTASLVPTTLAGHRFWEESDPSIHKNQLLHFVKNVSAMGGLLLASVDTEGKPGVAWRTKRAVGDVRREAKHLSRQAKSQARLTTKSVTS